MKNDNNMMYLVTGAAGFLGGEVCRQLCAAGENVRALVLPGDKSAQYLPEGAEVFEGDLMDEAALSEFFTVPEGVTTKVLHIASIVTVNPDYNPKVMAVNVDGTMNIIDQCLKHSECERMVYVSSTGAIPESQGKAISEVSRFDPDMVVGCYSRSKAMASQAVLDAVRRDGLNACIVHPSGIMGPGDFAVGETTGTLLRIIKGEMPAGIAGSFNLCDVRDLAAGVIAAADRGEKGECYILGNEAVTFQDFSRMVSDEAHTRPVRLFLPLGAANMMADVMERSARRSGKKPMMTRFSVYNLARNNRFDSTKAEEKLGYSHRSYRETIHDEIAWLRAQGMIA